MFVISSLGQKLHFYTFSELVEVVGPTGITLVCILLALSLLEPLHMEIMVLRPASPISPENWVEIQNLLNKKLPNPNAYLRHSASEKSLDNLIKASYS